MDMGTSSMDMGGAMATATATGTMAAESTAAAMDMGGGCQISMLWNWYTIDSCFISSTWKITSNGMFAGSCIGVILLVMSLEFLRRASREYDRYIVRQARNQLQHITSDVAIAIDPKINGPGPDSTQTVTIRAFFHMMQFAVAYFVMLLAMYYNGYIIISIIIGAFLGAFVFSWEPIDLRPNVNEEATVCCG
ncbi:ctr copper transporter [Botrytis cinerea]